MNNSIKQETILIDNDLLFLLNYLHLKIDQLQENDQIYTIYNKISQNFSHYIPMLRQVPQPVNIEPFTIGAKLFGCQYDYYGELAKTCSVLCMDEIACDYQIWLFDNQQIRRIYDKFEVATVKYLKNNSEINLENNSENYFENIKNDNSSNTAYILINNEIKNNYADYLTHEHLNILRENKVEYIYIVSTKFSKHYFLSGKINILNINQTEDIQDKFVPFKIENDQKEKKEQIVENYLWREITILFIVLIIVFIIVYYMK